MKIHVNISFISIYIFFNFQLRLHHIHDILLIPQLPTQ